MVLATTADRPEVDPHMYAWYLTEATWQSSEESSFCIWTIGYFYGKSLLGFLPRRIQGKSILDGLNI